MNPVISHCTVVAEMANSFIKSGKATFKIVWFKIDKNEPKSRTGIRIFLFTFGVAVFTVLLLSQRGIH
jgi:hypothetical protein